MAGPIKRVLSLLSDQERKRLYWLIPLVTLLALFEVVGVTSIAPFLLLLANPSSLDTNQFLNSMYVAFGFDSHRSFLLFTGVVATLFFALSNGTSMLTTWLLLRFAWRANHLMSTRLLSNYLRSPYESYLQQNSVDRRTNLLPEVQQAVQALLIPAMKLIAATTVSLFIVVLLLVVQPTLAVIAAIMLSSTYLVVYGLVRKTLLRIGTERVAAQSARYRLVAEALQSHREIELAGKESTFIDRFCVPSERYARHMATSQTLEAIPRYALDTVAFGTVLAVVLFFLATGRDVAAMLPVLGVFTFASYRLLPALQQVFQSASTIRFSTATLDVLLEAAREDQVRPFVDRSKMSHLPFERELTLDGVTYIYPGSRERVLDHLTLRITAGTSVAFVGKTGSGKTTAANLIMGLLRPTQGNLTVDGVPIDDRDLTRWQMNLGYIPQVVNLHDDTVTRNIAFGVPDDQVDHAAVEQAARSAQIHDFIMNELPEQYLTVIGEQGIRLSGGQRQRLGIARALYADPPVLVLDEATSALDSATENDVMLAIKDLAKMKTVIIIAHRLSTVADCDTLFLFDAGRIVAKGSFDSLFSSSSLFRTLSQGLVNAAETRQVVA